MQAIGVEAVGRKIAGGDHPHTVFKQRVQKAVQNHRIGDVSHVEFVKTNQSVALGHALTQLV